MNAKRLLVVLCVLLAGIPAAADAFGGPGGFHGSPGMGGGPGRILPILLREVDLSPTQRVRVGSIMRAHRASIEGLFGEMRASYEAVGEAAFGEEELTNERIDALIAQVNDVRARLMREGLKVVREVRSILSAEQLAKMDETKRRLQALRSEMHDLFGSPGSSESKDDWD